MSFSTQELNRNTVSIQKIQGFIGQNAQYKLENIIDSYCSDLVNAHSVLQTTSTTKEDLYGLVSKVPQCIDTGRISAFLNLPKINNLLNIVDYGISMMNDQEIFSIILPYIPSEKLIKNHLHLFEGKDEIILQKIIIPILEVLVQMHSVNLVHGCINLNNIWIDTRFDEKYDIDNITLSNTALEICGYNQHYIFEPLNRMLAHRAGKSHLSKSADCYAIGVLIASLFLSENMMKKGYDSIVTSKARLGSYVTFLNDTELNSPLQYTAYWLLHDDEDKRWTATQALKFLRRRHRKLTLLNIEKITTQDQADVKQLQLKQPLLFTNEECYSLTEAAVSAVRHYDEIKLKVKNGKLIKSLLQNESIPAEFISKVSMLRSLENITFKNGITQEDIFLTLFITLLNKNMPIKIKDICFEPIAVWQLTRYLMNKNLSTLSNVLQSAINNHMIEFIYDRIIKICNVKIPFQYNSKIKLLESLEFSANSMTSFAIHYMNPRCIYVNSLLENKLCFDNADILQMIDSSNEQVKSEILNDEKLLSIILSRLLNRINIQVTVNSVIDVKNDIFAKSLMILSTSHEIEYKKPLKSLCQYFYNKILTYNLNQIRYLPLRNKINEQLQVQVNEGNLNGIYKILSSKEIDRKHDMYLRVLDRVGNLNEKIHVYNKKSNSFEIIEALGRQRTLQAASVIFLCTLMFIFYNLFWI